MAIRQQRGSPREHSTNTNVGNSNYHNTLPYNSRNPLYTQLGTTDCHFCMRVLYTVYMQKKPKRYYNIRIDEDTYKAIRKGKGKQTIVDFMRYMHGVS